MKNLALLLAFMMVFLSVGCSRGNEEVTLVETSTDDAFLTQIWGDYLTDCSFTILNGTVQWESPNELKWEDYCQYLLLKMQRADDWSDMTNKDSYNGNTDFWVKREKLESYALKYFNSSMDFKTFNNDNIHYDETLDAVVFYPCFLDNLPAVPYNAPQEFPHDLLESIDIYSDGSIVAKISSPSAQAINPEKEFYYHNVLLNKRDDGSYYFVSCALSYTPTDYVKISGNYKEVPYPENDNTLDSFLGFNKENKIISVNATSNTANFFLSDIQTGKTEKTVSFPIDNPSVTLTKVLTDDFVVLALKDKIYYLPSSLEGEFKEISLPEEWLIYDVSNDLNQIIYDGGEKGVCLYNLAEKTSSTIPGSLPFAPAQSAQPKAMMSATRYADGRFVDDDKKVIMVEYGYEWVASYLLVDLALGEGTSYDYSSGYDGQRIITDSKMYIRNGNDIDSKAVFINFATGNCQEIATPINVSCSPYTSSSDLIAAVDYIGIPTDRRQLITTEVLLVDASSTQSPVTPTDCTITAPYGCILLLPPLPNGDIYATISFMGEKHAIYIEKE